MKYQFTNRLQDFEFHDNIWHLVSFESDLLVFTVSCLNVHKSALTEQFETDMEIADACLIFRGVTQLTYEPSRTWKQDADGKSYTDEPRIIYEGETAHNFFVAEMEDSPRIYGLQYTDEKCEVCGCGNDPYFTFCFSYKSAEISWECFKNIAWYHRPRTSNIQRIGE